MSEACQPHADGCDLRLSSVYIFHGTGRQGCQKPLFIIIQPEDSIASKEPHVMCACVKDHLPRSRARRPSARAPGCARQRGPKQVHRPRA